MRKKERLFIPSALLTTKINENDLEVRRNTARIGRQKRLKAEKNRAVNIYARLSEYVRVFLFLAGKAANKRESFGERDFVTSKNT